jgi:L-threonylcarbamoyladenylate synthase
LIIKDSEEARAEVARIVRRGGVIAFRTDTLYGLGADPLNRDAILKIRKLKGREDDKPILLLVSDEKEVARFIEDSSRQKMAAIGRWPAPLTLIGVAKPEVPNELTAGTGSLGVRLPDDEDLRALVRICGGALTATSANPSGQSPARNASTVADYFPELDLIMDGGEVELDLPSTIVDLTGDTPRLVREGVIRKEELQGLL